MIQSTFSQKPKSLLAMISSQLIKNDFDYETLYNNFDDNVRILEEVGKYFGEEIMNEDVQFFAKFIEINENTLTELYETKNKSLYNKIIIPVPKDYEIRYSVWGSCTYEKYYKDTITSYDEFWVRDMVQEDYNNGNFELYEGVSVNTEYDNYEMNDWSINEVSEKKNVRESLFTKLVLENTSSVLDSVDRDTLLKMKSIIESKLKSL
jgi:hypothetical protein